MKLIFTRGLKNIHENLHHRFNRVFENKHQIYDILKQKNLFTSRFYNSSSVNFTIENEERDTKQIFKMIEYKNVLKFGLINIREILTESISKNKSFEIIFISDEEDETSYFYLSIDISKRKKVYLQTISSIGIFSVK